MGTQTQTQVLHRAKPSRKLLIFYMVSYYKRLLIFHYFYTFHWLKLNFTHLDTLYIVSGQRDHARAALGAQTSSDRIVCYILNRNVYVMSV